MFAPADMTPSRPRRVRGCFSRLAVRCWRFAPRSG